MATYKFTYFNGRGLGETSRLIFAAAGEKYDDVRIESDQWPQHKTEMPTGEMPVLEYNGVQLPQSASIARFLAKQFNLAGKDTFDQAKVDAVIDTIYDLLRAMIPLHREEDEAKKKELTAKFLNEGLPKHLQNFETLAKSYGNGGLFFVSNQLTWADLFFYDIGEKLLSKEPNALEKNPWLKANRAEVEKQPKIAEYLKNRPKTAF